MIEHNEALQARKDSLNAGALKSEMKTIVNKISSRRERTPTAEELKRIARIKEELREISQRGLTRS